MDRFGFVRVAVGYAETEVGNPRFNARQILALLDQPQARDADVVLLPELAITGYTCADLFKQELLIREAGKELLAVAAKVGEQLVVVGAPIAVRNNLYNCAVAMNRGRILGIVPKQWLPNYKEFYEGRWFRGADGHEPDEIAAHPIFAEHGPIPFGTDLLFQDGELCVGIEICEDLWMPVPPSSYHAIAGANLLLNLSASNELVAKAEYRRELVKGQSARCIAAYAYASCGPTESTTDLVFGGHCLVAENGTVVVETARVGDGGFRYLKSDLAAVEIDIEKLMTERRLMTSFGQCVGRIESDCFRRVPFALRTREEPAPLTRKYAGQPFVPKDPATLQARCNEVFHIQCSGLAKRLGRLPANTPVVVGVSGGLDSTLALMVLAKTYDMLGRPRGDILGVTMPGFGTSAGTRSNAIALMEHLGVSQRTIPIDQLSFETFAAVGHNPFDLPLETLEQFRTSLQGVEGRQDLAFENVQARMRTLVLMTLGFVVGTGDLSESALGWSTYNGDHMSMYNVNSSIPKTLVRWLVRYVAESEFEGPARRTLLDIADTVISPELLPLGKDGKIRQSTEDVIGPYELHDFFLFHSIRNGFSPEKVLHLARHADFAESYDEETLERTFRTFVRRFFANQFKRSCVPDGPKVGSVSLSPRGDWRMPSDADPALWKDFTPRPQD